jgi:hypothetical protein
MAVREHDVLNAPDRRGLVRNESGIAGEKRSIRTACPAKSSRKAEWPNQVMCMTDLDCWNIGKRSTIVARERIEKFVPDALIAA